MKAELCHIDLTIIYLKMLIAANFALLNIFINMQIIFVGDFYYWLLHNLCSL